MVKGIFSGENLLLTFKGLFVRNGKFLTALLATGSQYTAAVGGGHSLTESVFVLSFSPGRLICTFHGRSKIRAAKMDSIWRISNFEC